MNHNTLIAFGNSIFRHLTGGAPGG
jgi:hypothetical protein